MLRVDNIKVFNFEGALRGMRNPKNSHHLSDSAFGLSSHEYTDIDYDVTEAWVRKELGDNYEEWSQEFEATFEKYNSWLMKNGITDFNGPEGVLEYAFIGPKDMRLAQTLIGAGTDHSKFMRQIFVTMDIDAPLYWWKEFDTYKVGTVANSESTMHKLADMPITEDRFSWDTYYDLELIDPTGSPDIFFKTLVSDLEQLRQLYKETGDKRYWRALIQLLPSNWMQKRTVTLSYQNCRAMQLSRDNHKLIEWADLIKVFKILPYAEEFIFYVKPKTINEENIVNIVFPILEMLGIEYEDEVAGYRKTEDVMKEFKEKIKELLIEKRELDG